MQFFAYQLERREVREGESPRTTGRHSVDQSAVDATMDSSTVLFCGSH